MSHCNIKGFDADSPWNFKLIGLSDFYDYMNCKTLITKEQNCHISKAAIDKPIYSLRIVFVLKCHILAYPNVNSQGCLAIWAALTLLLK